MAKIENTRRYAIVVHPWCLLEPAVREGKDFPLKILSREGILYFFAFFLFFLFQSDKKVIIHFPSVNEAHKQQHSSSFPFQNFHRPSCPWEINIVERHGRPIFLSWLVVVFPLGSEWDRESGKVNNNTTENVSELCTFEREMWGDVKKCFYSKS